LAIPGDSLEIRNKLVFVHGKQSPIPSNILYQNQSIQKLGIKNSRIFPPSKNWNEDNYGPIVVPQKGDKINLTLENIYDWKMIINREFGNEVVQINNGEIFINGINSNEYTLKNDY
jgi:signal peptidase I